MSVYVPRNGERQYVTRNGETEFVAFHDNGDGTMAIVPVYPDHFDLATGREYIAPPDCDCDGCTQAQRQEVPHSREIRTRPAKAQIPAVLRRAVHERDAYRCQWPECGTWLDLTIDHIIPEALGGPTELGNLQTLCRPHNSEKGVRVL